MKIIIAEWWLGFREVWSLHQLLPLHHSGQDNEIDSCQHSGAKCGLGDYGWPIVNKKAFQGRRMNLLPEILHPESQGPVTVKGEKRGHK